MKKFFYLIIIVLLYEFLMTYLRQLDRKKIYIKAFNRSRDINRKLVVIGDPYYGKSTKFFLLFNDTYGCGDETVDLTGAPKCKNGIKSDLLSYLYTKETNSCVIFISCVLEYVDDIDLVIKELYRVSGGPQNIFVVTVNQYTLSAYFYNEDNYSSKQIIYAPPDYKTITYKKI